MLIDSHKYFHFTDIFVLSHLWSLMYSLTERDIARSYILCGCMYVYMHVHIHTYIYSLMQFCLYQSMHTFIHTYMSPCIHPYMETPVCMYTYMHIYMYRLMHFCLHTYMHTHTYIHTLINNNYECLPTFILR